VGDVGRVFAFFVSTGVLPVLVVGVAASAVTAWVAVRRGWVSAPGWLAFVAMLSVSGILVFTVFREATAVVTSIASGEPFMMPGWLALREWSADGVQRVLADPLGKTTVLLNIALFVPAGFVWTVITRRPWRVLAALGVMSAGIEVLQGVTGLGAHDVGDIVANVAGALVGVGAAVVLGWTVDVWRGHRVGARRWALRGMLVAAVCAALFVLPGTGASWRQAAVAERAADVFAGTTVADVDRWERDDQVMDRVWKAVTSDLADGWSRDMVSASASARYPVVFLGQRRCVLVVWGPSTVSVHTHTGSICERSTL
jgi:hypothetical protein